MKKLFALALVLVMSIGVCGMALAAEDGLTLTSAPTVNVCVTVSTAGKLNLAHKSVSVSDIDADGVISICDALYAAHETAYTGGAAAGFGSAKTDYGISLTKLWGVENGGSYGYYLNNASPLSLLDPVKEGDCVTAFAYADLTAWSDVYTYFDVDTAASEQGKTLALTLSSVGFDAEWNPVVLPVGGAIITLDGVDTAFVTDEQGKVTVTLDKVGEIVISARSDSKTLVPPVCIATVGGAASEAESQDIATAPQEQKAPNPIVYIIVAVVVAVVVVMLIFRKKPDEKK